VARGGAFREKGKLNPDHLGVGLDAAGERAGAVVDAGVVAPGRRRVLFAANAILRQRFASHICRAINLDENANTCVRADMRLLARQQQFEYRIPNRPAFVQLGLSVETQETRIQHTFALRLEIRVNHADALVVAEIL
jgi:hypothetical protein